MGEDQQAAEKEALVDHIRMTVPAMLPDLAERIAESLLPVLGATWDAGGQAAMDWIKSGAWLATLPENPYWKAADNG